MTRVKWRTCTGNPNTLGEVGALTEKIFDTANKIEYQCKTAGTGAWQDTQRMSGQLFLEV